MIASITKKLCQKPHLLQVTFIHEFVGLFFFTSLASETFCLESVFDCYYGIKHYKSIIL